jgi:hypothetical protein
MTELRRHIAVAGLAAIVAGCTPGSHPDLASAVQPSEIAYAVCLQYRPGGGDCTGLRLPDPASALAYGTCLEYHNYHKLEVKACDDLRLAYETELRAYLERPEATPEEKMPKAGAQIAVQRARTLRNTAEALYKATSRDAQTFAAALLIPEVRLKVEHVWGQKLSDDELHKLADQARAEALYWYAYMQGLERTQNIH